MPSEKVLQEKQALVAGLSDRLNASVAGVIVSYKGITVEDDTVLRRKLREAGVNYSVVKNTLLRRATESNGLSELDAVLEGTTALATSDNDHVAAAKILYEYAKDHENFTLKGGYLDGKVLSMDELTELAKIPSKEVLLAKVVGGLNATICKLVYVLDAIAKKEAEGAPAEEAAPAAEAAPAEAPAEEAAAEAPAEAPAEA